MMSERIADNIAALKGGADNDDILADDVTRGVVGSEAAGGRQ